MSGAGEDGPRVVGEDELYRGFVRLSRVTVEMRWRGATHRIMREIHDHGHVAALAPVDVARRTGLLLRQFRVSPFLDGEDGWLWEIPAGLLDGDAPDVCAERETREEAGVSVWDIAPLGVAWTSPGIVRERVHLFWGVYSGPPPSATGGLDHESEMIEIREMTMGEIGDMLDSGRITDAKSALALYRLRTIRPDLFAAS